MRPTKPDPAYEIYRLMVEQKRLKAELIKARTAAAIWEERAHRAQAIATSLTKQTTKGTVDDIQ